jgi:RHS repeat-associated protein
VLQSYDYAYDDVGNRTAVTTATGTESYTYDDLNRLTAASYPGGPNVSYTYDAAGNRTSMTRGGTTTDYTYDEAGQILTAGAKSFDHDGNGNVVSAGAHTFTYDTENRLTSASVASHTATYTYDGDGVKTSTTVDSDTDPLIVDRQGGLPTIVDDGERAYLHAGGLQAQIAGTSAEYALADGLGSIRGLSGTAGTLDGSASWEAFGEAAGTSGASSIFGFTGEPMDATGLVDLRARTLDPGIGRFLSADTVSPNAPGTQGYSLYAYVANNPGSWTDPTGRFAESPLDSYSAQQVQLSFAVLDSLMKGQLPALAAVGLASCVVFRITCGVVLGVAIALVFIAVAILVALAIYGAGSSEVGAQPSDEDLADADEKHPTPTPLPGPIGGGGDDDDEVRDRRILYHYTSAEGMAGILTCQCINASSGRVNARHGPGAYFTDLAPASITGTTPGQLSRALYDVPWNLRRVTNYIALDASRVVPTPHWVAKLNSNTYPGSIYLSSSTSVVSIVGAVLGAGEVEFGT